MQILKEDGGKYSGRRNGGDSDRRRKIIQGADMQVPSDRIVAGTYLCAAAATRGRIEIQNPPQGELTAFLEVYRKMGGQYEWNSGKLVADGSGCDFLFL